MEFIKHYWWIFIILFLLGTALNGIHDLKNTSFRHYLNKRHATILVKINQAKTIKINSLTKLTDGH